MKFEIYTVKDIVAGQFNDLKLFNNKEMALRWFNGLCAESKIAKDLQLFKLGTYNVESGQIDATDVVFVQGGVVVE